MKRWTCVIKAQKLQCTKLRFWSRKFSLLVSAELDSSVGLLSYAYHLQHTLWRIAAHTRKPWMPPSTRGLGDVREEAPLWIKYASPHMGFVIICCAASQLDVTCGTNLRTYGVSCVHFLLSIRGLAQSL